ncbi:MAG: arsenite S-adenosylmethyltransferase [Candidatus Thorarchaeota archaeon]|nr:MAG: arsenite S-adenosylmethyltransferase [Candidatus Thorarchaeota archaeon]
MRKESKSIKKHVKQHYAEVAQRAQAPASCSCSSSCCGSVSKAEYAEAIGYIKEQIVTLPDGAIAASAGCGNPTALAELQDGETVLDLGSGGGIDVFLAAKRVGPHGRVIGVDMTPDMIELAEKGAKEMGLENVEFRLGDIEELPVENQSVDVIISNCVINLAPDKDKVFREAYRVLKPGGRLMVSDIVTDGELPKAVRDNPDAWAGCVAGALDERDYLAKIHDAGFQDVETVSKKRFVEQVYSAEVKAFKPI